jgi:hypothetical protein
VNGIFALVRGSIDAIAKEEQVGLTEMVHLLPAGPRREEIAHQRLQRLYALKELLFGPANLAATRIGWEERTVSARLTELLTAAQGVTSWDRWRANHERFDRYCTEIVKAPGEPHWQCLWKWRPPTPTGRPGDDLAALLGEMQAALCRVLAFAASDATPASPAFQPQQHTPLTSPATPAEQYVTLDQAATLVNRSKKTLERRLYNPRTGMPLPAVEGGGGRPHEWLWSELRPWLEQEFGRRLPERLLRVS